MASVRAIRLVFLGNGMVFAGWAPLVPLVKAALALDEAVLGLALLALGAGAMLSMPIAGWLVARHGSRGCAVLSGMIFAATLPLLAMAPPLPVLAATLFLFGAANGVMDVSMNAQAVVVERAAGRPLMSSIHGLFSVGGLTGALVISLLLWAGLAPVLAAALLGAAVLAMLALQYPALLPAAADGSAGEGGLTLPRGPVLVLGALGFLAFMAEGSMLDWSAVFLTTARGADAGLAGMGFAAFSVAMAVVRLCGDIIVARLGAVAVVAGGAILAAAGFGIAVTLPTIGLGLAGFVLVGLGLGNIIPLLFGAAGRLDGVPAGIAIPGVATLGYMGILLGPALIGLVAQVVSLPVALGLLGALLLLVAARARLVAQ